MICRDLHHVRLSPIKSTKRSLLLLGLISTIVTISLYLSFFYDEPEVHGWNRNQSRYIPDYISPNVKTTLIEPTYLCKDNSRILLLIMVSSAVGNFEARQTVRETWANTTEFNYSKFSTIHSQLIGKYLPINSPNWEIYIVKNGTLHAPNDTIIGNNSHNDTSTHVDFQMRVVFLVGLTNNNETQEQIGHESRRHNDLIQENFVDSYNNLTLKSIMMLKWMKNNCDGKVKFLMKCDDDTFVNVPNLIHLLLGGTVPVYAATLNKHNVQTVQTLLPENRLKQFDNLLIGSRFCLAKPAKNSNSKWFTPSYMFKGFYPKYLSGSGYVLSMDTAKKLYNASLDIPFLHLEDVFLTGICAEKAYVEPINHQLFHYEMHKDWCDYRGLATLHQIESSVMRRAYEFVMNPNNTCAAPSQYAWIRSKKFCE